MHCHCREYSLGRWEWAGEEGPMLNTCVLLAGLPSASPSAEAAMPEIRGDTSDSPALGNHGREPRAAG